MKTYEQIIAGYAAAVWDGKSDVRCSTGVFTPEKFRAALRLPPDAEVYLIGSARRHVPTFVGTRWDTDEGETTADCARRRVAEFAEQEYNAQLAEGAELVCPHQPDADETIHFDGKDEFFN